MSAARSLAGLGALLLLASCGGAATINPQAGTPSLAPTLVSLGPAPRSTELKGLSPTQVAALYGDPDLKRLDPPAEIWQYRSADCVLDLFFYDDKDGTRLVYAESRMRSPQRGAISARCADGSAPLQAHIKQTKL